MSCNDRNGPVGCRSRLERFSMNKSNPRVTVCATYWSNEVVVRFAEELAATHVADVHVGRLVNGDTGESSPAFVLSNRLPRAGHTNRPSKS